MSEKNTDEENIRILEIREENTLKINPVNDLEGRYNDLLKINDCLTKSNRRMFETLERIRKNEYYTNLNNKILRLEEDYRVLKHLYLEGVYRNKELKDNFNNAKNAFPLEQPRGNDEDDWIAGMQAWFKKWFGEE